MVLRADKDMWNERRGSLDNKGVNGPPRLALISPFLDFPLFLVLYFFPFNFISGRAVWFCFMFL